MRRLLPAVLFLLAAVPQEPAARSSFALPSGAAEDRPNILWVTCEDISLNVACYGDSYAVTPNIDRLARQGVRYTNAFAPIGVCAPSRSTLILGTFAP